MEYLTPEIYNDMVDQKNQWKEKYSDLEAKYKELWKEYHAAARQANMHPLVGEIME